VVGDCMRCVEAGAEESCLEDEGVHFCEIVN
jgi:hypothetical protein